MVICETAKADFGLPYPAGPMIAVHAGSRCPSAGSHTPNVLAVL